MILSKNKEYHFFNLLVFIAIAVMFLYLKTDLISIKCPYSEIGLKCKTCGLTSSFKKAASGNFTTVNFSFLLLFAAFTSQLIMRPLVSLALLFTTNWKRVRNIDIFFCVLLFGYSYLELLLNTF